MRNANGGYAVIWERGSRLIGLVPGKGAESAVWVDFRALEEGTWNVGGDRTWISPEFALFADASGRYDIPAQLDPGSYRFLPAETAEVVRTEQMCELTHWPDRRSIPIRLTKEYRLIANPFDRVRSDEYRKLAQLPFIGCQIETRLQLLYDPEQMSDRPLPAINLWSILQVHPGGTVLVPVHGNAEPLVMHRERRLPVIESQPAVTSFPFRGDDGFKLSFHSLQSTGRFGYFRRLGPDAFSLIVRQFRVHPSALYPDHPEDRPDYTGSCMQFFYDGGKMGGYGELEYHAPSIDGRDATVQSDTSQLYYFVGTRDQIADIAHHLLGTDLSGVCGA
ncbi:hypothetical protein [Paenibacillus flagellatus]|uniref:hypothetical protein n=1 Tax=Paenibacillus flagellatus TaxID=2211139 RepID=UPI0011B62A68|nr:hypothetical protein [Paenibacillus flagellatus]